jgi:hypothetical protein
MWVVSVVLKKLISIYLLIAIVLDPVGNNFLTLITFLYVAIDSKPESSKQWNTRNSRKHSGKFAFYTLF